MSAPSNPAVGAGANAEAVAKIHGYTRKVLELFPDGEDTAVVLSALDQAVALVTLDVGVDIEVFVEAIRMTRQRLEARRKSRLAVPKEGT